MGKEVKEKSLFGALVLVTRETERALETAAAIEARGGRALLFPTIEVAPPEEESPLEEALRGIYDYGLVVVSSKSAVSAIQRVASRLEIRLDPERLPPFAAVGEKTALALKDLGVRKVYVPERQDALGLAEMLRSLEVRGPVLVLRAEKGREVVARELRARGIEVHEVVAYRTLPRRIPTDEVERLLGGERPEVALFMSPSAFNAFVGALGLEVARPYLSSVILCALGETTAQAMKDLGFEPTLVPPTPDLSVLFDLLSPLVARSRGLFSIGPGK